VAEDLHRRSIALFGGRGLKQDLVNERAVSRPAPTKALGRGLKPRFHEGGLIDATLIYN
jgi:hypothetical protein